MVIFLVFMVLILLAAVTILYMRVVAAERKLEDVQGVVFGDALPCLDWLGMWNKYKDSYFGVCDGGFQKIGQQDSSEIQRVLGSLDFLER